MEVTENLGILIGTHTVTFSLVPPLCFDVLMSINGCPFTALRGLCTEASSLVTPCSALLPGVTIILGLLPEVNATPNLKGTGFLLPSA